MNQDQFHVRSLLESLGFEAKQTDQGSLDEALRWALVELHIRRDEVLALHQKVDGLRDELDDMRYELAAATERGHDE